MAGKTILVTGGAGYVGAVLVPKLLREGYRVKVLDLYLYGGRVLDSVAGSSRLKQIKGDLRNIKILKECLAGVDDVIHLACISNDPSFELDPKLGKSINFEATRQLIDLCVKSGIKRFIYASSSSVYGVKREAEVTEELNLEPLTDYSKYKAECEKYLLSKMGKMCGVILRPATVCGWSPRLRLDLTVNILTINALVNKKIIVHGGSQMRPNIHIEDMTDCYIALLKQPESKIKGKIYNAGYENYSIAALARMVVKVIGDFQIKIEKVNTTDHRSYRVNSDLIKRELGFGARHTVEEAIGDLVRAYKEGKIPKALADMRYYNIKTMQHFFKARQ